MIMKHVDAISTKDTTNIHVGLIPIWIMKHVGLTIRQVGSNSRWDIRNNYIHRMTFPFQVRTFKMTMKHVDAIPSEGIRNNYEPC